MSNVIKSTHVLTQEELKKLFVTRDYTVNVETSEPEVTQVQPLVPDEEVLKLRDKIIEDAKLFAASRIQDAADECERLFEEARTQIEQWWEEQRSNDEQIKSDIAQQAHEEAYGIGLIDAQQEMKKQWETDINEAAVIVSDAYKTREQIIQDAEPYIVDLTCSIAEKIIGKQLEVEPQIVLDIIKRTLSRRREQGEITLCVAPNQLSFVQAAKEELMASIDSQAELIIIPDTSVTDQGCVIRSKFGSIDARIDTQLSEIKRELLVIAHQTVQESRQDDDQA